ncbi:MAG TPA: NYN domain-containing protein [Patescibacteria group bacterium]|jgi:uncharacterized LabA/DUF88 family protein
MKKEKYTILYVDSENLKFYIKKVINQGSQTADANSLDFDKLFSSTLKGIMVNTKRFYSAKLRVHPDFTKKSQELIQNQRVLKSKLEKQGFEFIISGNVRGQTIALNGKSKVVFREKGVDVKIAVDMVAEACDEKVERIILCSSDSDLQPAVTEVKKRGVEVIYLGFEMQPNKGLMYTTDRAILMRNAEILDAVQPG